MRKRLIIILSSMGILLLFSCRSGVQEKQTAAGSQIEILNEFMIIGYCGPPQGEVTLERYREIAESGIEILVPGNGTFDAASNIKALDLAEQVGIKIIPVDMRIMPFALAPDISVDTSVIRALVKDYKDHPALAGYVIKDEPNADLFPVLGKISALFRAEDPLHEPVINLFPSYGSPTQLGFEDYRAYVRSYIETVKPELLSYDNYPLRVNETVYDAWYKDLTIVREETLEAGIPFIVFILSEGIVNGFRVPNRAEILWQVNSALAYGPQGLGWFCYWTPEPDQGFQQEEGAAPPLIELHYNAMINLKGERTQVYKDVKEANSYMKKAGRGLLGWESIAVARYEAGIMLEGGVSPVVTPSGDQANLVIGTFEKPDCNCRRIIISNASCEEPANFSLQLSADWKMDEIFTSIDATRTGENESPLEWFMEPGGSVIIDLR